MRSTRRSAAPAPIQKATGLKRAGYQLLISKHYFEAIEVWKEIREDDPNNAEAPEVIGLCYVQLRQFTQAEECYRDAVRLSGSKILPVLGLAEVLAYQGKHEEALTVLRSVAPDPRAGDQEAGYQAAFGNVLALCFDLEGAKDHFIVSLDLNPRIWLTWMGLGHVYTEQRELDKAAECYERAYSLQKNLQTAHSLGECRMRQGLWEQGWRLWETRIGEPKLGHRDIITPRWDGTETECLCLWHEGGVGDLTHFTRYLPLAAAKARVVKLVLPPHIIDWVDSFELPDNVELVENIALGSYDTQAAFMSLPLVTGRYSPTEAPPPLKNLIDTFLFRPALGKPYMVVLNWFGDKNHPNDIARSTKLEQWADLIRSRPDITWVSLAPEAFAKGEIDRLGLPIEWVTGTLNEAARSMKAANLVISVDSGQAHIAGTLGVPCWTLVTYAPEWRWGTDGDTTPLYPTMKLYRETKPRDWSETIARIGADLKEMLP